VVVLVDLNLHHFILDKYGLRWVFLRDIVLLRCRGRSNSDIAKDLHLNRNTVNKYVNALKTMEREDFLYILEAVLSSMRGLHV